MSYQKFVFCKKALPLIAYVAAFVAHSHSASGPPLKTRGTVLVLPPKCAHATADELHWEPTLRELLGFELQRHVAVRIAPESSLNWASRTVAGDEPAIARGQRLQKLGQLTASDWVLEGEYSRTQSQWSLAERLTSAATGRTSEALTVSGPTCAQVLCKMATLLAAKLGTPRRTGCSLQASDAALELLSLGYDLSRSRGQVSTVRSNLAAAVALAPQCALLRQALAQAEAATGDLEAATADAEEATKADPAYAAAATTLGIMYEVQNMPHLAVEQFEKAAALDPYDAENPLRMGQICYKSREYEKATALLSRASELSPYDPVAHVMLAEIYKVSGQLDLAAAQLSLAEACASREDCDSARLLGAACEMLNETAKAVHYYERFVECGHEVGLVSDTVRATQARIDALQARLEPHLVDLPPERESSQPRPADPGYAAEVAPLMRELLACTPEMAQLARKTVSPATNDFRRATLLFRALTRPVSLARRTGWLTAKDAYDEWSQPSARVTCHGFTLLYTALARSVGLAARYVLVTRDYEGHETYHACAGVIIDGRVLLVDPVYQWLGVPHKAFEVETDDKMLALALAVSNSAERERLAVQVCPRWPLAYFLSAVSARERGDKVTAESRLATALKLDSLSWWSYYTRACVADADEDWSNVAKNATECLSRNPDWGPALYLLARASEKRGNIEAARRAYISYLEHVTDPADAAMGRVALWHLRGKADELGSR